MACGRQLSVWGGREKGGGGRIGWKVKKWRREEDNLTPTQRLLEKKGGQKIASRVVVTVAADEKETIRLLLPLLRLSSAAESFLRSHPI